MSCRVGSLLLGRPPGSTLFPYTTLFRSDLRSRLDNFSRDRSRRAEDARSMVERWTRLAGGKNTDATHSPGLLRSEEHTSELQPPVHPVCRLLLDNQNNIDLSRYAPESNR